MAEQPRKGMDPNLIPIKELITPPTVKIKLSIAPPDIEADNFHFPGHVVVYIRQSMQFDGLHEEDAVEHIRNFNWLCTTMKFNGVSDDALKLRLFPYTLQGKALRWLHILPEESITTWDQLQTSFLAQYFPEYQRIKLRRNILSFQQDEDETLYDAWERFKDMIWKCPLHGLQTWEQVQIFYNGLDYQHRSILDHASYGGFFRKNAIEAFNIIQSEARKDFRINVESRKKSKEVARAEDIGKVVALCAKMVAVLENLVAKANESQLPACNQACYYCGGKHKSEDCLKGGEVPPANHEENVDFLAIPSTNNNPYSNTCNMEWKNHPNCSWRHDDQQQQPPYSGPTQQTEQRYNVMQEPQQTEQQQPPQRYQPPHQREPSFEDDVTRYMQQNDARVQAIESSFKNIVNQLEKLIKVLSERSEGSLP